MWIRNVKDDYMKENIYGIHTFELRNKDLTEESLSQA